MFFSPRSSFSRRLALAAGTAALLAGCASPPPPTAASVVAAPPLPTLQIQQLDRGVLIVLPTVVLFEVGRFEFDRRVADPYLDRLAYLLKTKTAKRVSVEGHTDADGSAALNETLARNRAAAVSQALAARGIAAERLSTEGFSFNRPVASNATPDGKRLNRRVEIIVIDETVANITAGEAPGSFEQAWAELKSLLERGLIKPAEGRQP
jgi:outer membrane protein OmpA-like peptidoglycan-associated protein